MFFTRFWIVVVLVFIATTFGDHIPIPAPVSQNVYWKAACRGAQLIGAMQNSEPQAKLFLLPTSSAWDGELRSELALWGYIETERDQMCDFDQFWHLAWPFDVYGLDARPKSRGGPNICHSAVHGNPWKRKLDGSFWPMGEQTYAVAGKTYRATGGFSTIGINPIAGMLFFIARKSPTRGAAELWNIPNPLLADLPAIRAQSDIAWGFWNRVMKGKNLGNIRAFWCIGVVSQQTNAIINQAHATFDRGDGRGVPGRTLVFPGVNFPIESVEAQAILGKNISICYEVRV